MENKLIPMEYKNQRIMTTKVLAEAYGTNEDNIKANFNRNKERFIEGKHYYQLEGEELKEFKRVVTKSNDPSIKFASVLTLWTDRGAARHAKILDTNEAWEVYEKLEDTYFKVQEIKENIRLNLANKEIERLEATVNKFEKLTEEAKLQYKPSHKRKLDYNKMIKSLTNNDEETQVVKDWTFGLLGIEKWEDTCVDDSKKIIETITTIARLLTIKKFEQLRLF